METLPSQPSGSLWGVFFMGVNFCGLFVIFSEFSRRFVVGYNYFVSS
jgi:hypothetical protein